MNRFVLFMDDDYDYSHNLWPVYIANTKEVAEEKEKQFTEWMEKVKNDLLDDYGDYKAEKYSDYCKDIFIPYLKNNPPPFNVFGDNDCLSPIELLSYKIKIHEIESDN